MGERVTKLTLVAQASQYMLEVERAKQKTREFGTEAEKLAQKKEVFSVLGRSMLALGTVAGVAVGMAVAKFAEFDQAMSNVSAATHETTGNMSLLREAALDAGARTVFSATESANAIEELGKAGLATADILGGGLDGALDLAAAGGLGVADAAGIAAVALKTFNLQGSDMSHVADLLAAGAGKAMGDVSDLSAALSQGGQVAAATGLSIEETTAALSAFASKGLLGSDAGTSFKSMLQSLTPTSAAAKGKMDELGISAYDAQGNFIGLAEFAGSLRNGLKDLSVEQQQAALKTIFGSDAIRAASVLYSEGEEGIRDWIAAVDDQGYAADTAAERLNNLMGDIEALGGAVDTALIKTGSGANAVLRAMAQEATELVDGYNDLPPVFQGTVLVLGAVATAAVLSGGAFFTAVPKIAEYRLALETMGPTAQRAGRAMALVGKSLGAVAAVSLGLEVLSKIAHSFDAAAASSAELANKLTVSQGAVKTLETAMQGLDAFSMKVAKKDWGEFVDQISNAPDMRWLPGVAHDIFSLDPAADSAREKFAELGKEMVKLDPGEAGRNYKSLVKELGGTKESQQQLLDLMPDYKEALREQATALGLTTDNTTLLKLANGELDPSTKKTKNSLEDIAGAATNTSDAVAELAGQIRDFGSAQFDVENASIAFYDAFDSLQQILAEGSGSLDVTTEAGRNTMSAMLDVASSTNDYAAAVYAMGGSTEDVQTILSAGRQKIIDTRIALGETEAQAKTYADRLLATPEAIKTRAELDTSDAEASLSRFLASVASARPHIATTWSGGVTQAEGAVMKFYRNGGMSENHVAQIAPAGAWRVWAEPETGGESYIPHAPSKRARSLSIWETTGRILGVEGFADGGVAAKATSYQSMSTHGYAPASVTQYSASNSLARPAWLDELKSLRGETYAPQFNLVPERGRPLADQVFDAARRSRTHRRS